jgi:hypothetical protein
MSVFCFAEPITVGSDDLYLHQGNPIELQFQLNDHGSGPFHFIPLQTPIGSTLSSNGYFHWPQAILGQHIIEFNAINSSNTAKFYSLDLSIGDEPPIATEDHLQVTEDSSATTINVLSNDYDLNQDPITASNLSISSLGEAILTPDGTFTFKPSQNSFGTESLNYIITANGINRTSQIHITILPVNDRPIVNLQPIPSLDLPSGEMEYKLDNWIFSVSPGPLESNQTLAIQLKLIHGESLFYKTPELHNDKDLIFTPKLNATGNALLQLYIQDDGGIVNNGSDNTTKDIILNFNQIGQEHLQLQKSQFITAIRNHPNEFQDSGLPKASVNIIEDLHPNPQSPFHGMYRFSFDLNQIELDSSSIIDIFIKRESDPQKLKIAEIDLSLYSEDETSINYFWNSRTAKFDWMGEAFQNSSPILWTLDIR